MPERQHNSGLDETLRRWALTEPKNTEKVLDFKPQPIKGVEHVSSPSFRASASLDRDENSMSFSLLVLQANTRTHQPPLYHGVFVSAEQGKVLKVLHTSEGVFIISQYSVFRNEGPVLNMAIDSQKVRRWTTAPSCGQVWKLHSLIDLAARLIKHTTKKWENTFMYTWICLAPILR